MDIYNFFYKLSKFRFIFSVLLFLHLQMTAQAVQKKTLTEGDYLLWGKLNNHGISPTGRWLSYSMEYDASPDTLYVQHTATKKRLSFAEGYNGIFGSNSVFACKIQGDTLAIVNLLKGFVQLIPNAGNFQFSANGKFIVYQSQKDLIVKDFESQKEIKIVGVLDWQIAPSGNFITCSTLKGVSLLKLDNKLVQVPVMASEKAVYSNIEWDETSRGFTFLSSQSPESTIRQQHLYYYRLIDKRLFSTEGMDTESSANDWNFSVIKPAISPDGKRVFVTMEVPSKQILPERAQIWNTQDDYIRTLSVRSTKLKSKKLILIWYPDIKRVVRFTDSNTTLKLGGEMKTAITAEPVLPQSYLTLHPKMNYSIVNIESGKKTTLMENTSSAMEEIIGSPNGRYFAYFDKENLYIYDCKTNRKVISRLPKSFLKGSNTSRLKNYGICGWTVNDNYLIVYDTYDVYKISKDGSLCERLTKGKETGTIYRVVKNKKKWSHPYLQNNEMEDIAAGLIMEVKDTTTNASGYALWKFANQKILTFGDYKYTELHRSTDKKTVTVIEEDFENPPRLVEIATDTGSLVKQFQSNIHYANYNWGRSKKIHYKIEGKNISAILYYPSEYDENKKYPMIVRIYETQSWSLHSYYNPSLLNGTGFNVANLTSQGYFVLCPNIEYVLGAPGESALKYTLGAVESAIENAKIDRAKIGLIGHSFGGYESAYIATQTNVFATVVSGAGFMDLPRFYLSISANHKVPEYWRFEDDQQRMKTSPFENWDAYDLNSPLRFSKLVTIPILTYTGEDDTQVDANQSISFFLALKRLAKENVMLIYPKEGHIFENEANQSDLTCKIEQWFGYYLKNEAYPKWAQAYKSK